MKKLLLAAAFAFSASIGAYSQGIYNFPEDKYDFGVIEEGVIASHEFDFTNSGHDSLHLKRELVRPSCGCTTPKLTEGSIAPGAKGKITAEYNSMGRVGTFNKTINIFDSTNAILKVLTIKGTVIKKEEAPKLTEAQLKKASKVSIDKHEHNFGKIEKGQSLTAKFQIKNSGKDTLKLSNAQVACGCVTYKLLSGKDNANTTFILPGKSAVLEVVYSPLATGKNRDIITFFTTDPSNPRLPITLIADVVESIMEKSPVKQNDQGSPFQK